MIRLAWSSVAALAVAPLQDVLSLGSEARMNRPGRPEGNWRWRLGEMLAGPMFDRLGDLTERSARSPASIAASTAAVLHRDLPTDPIGDASPRRPCMTTTLGYDRPLYILPFDHRGTFQSKMFGWKGTLNAEQTAKIAARSR